jgi:hypothetical protein
MFATVDSEGGCGQACIPAVDLLLPCGAVRAPGRRWLCPRLRWVVEARAGGAEGRIKRQECRDEREALAVAEQWREFGGDDWTDISGAHRPR